MNRFWDKVHKTERCWIWTAYCDSFGYGKSSFRNETLAHRISLILVGREPPFEGSVARHKCDNPSCVNPDHLEWGTHADNMRDCIDRDRFPWGNLIRRHEALRAKRRPSVCKQCGKGITITPAGERRGKKYCSRACHSAAHGSITHCKRGHEFTPENTRIGTKGERRCRACARLETAQRYRRKKADEARVIGKLIDQLHQEAA